MLWTCAKTLILKSCLHSSRAVTESFVCFIDKLRNAESMSSCTGNQTNDSDRNSVAFVKNECKRWLTSCRIRVPKHLLLLNWGDGINVAADPKPKKLEMFACCELLCMLDRYSIVMDDNFWSISYSMYFIKVVFRSCIILALHLF